MGVEDKRLNLDKYKGKKVLVTGHTGFKGSWLCMWLLKAGASVIGVSKDPYTKYDNFVLAKLSNKIVDLRNDIRNLDEMEKIFDKYEPEVVFHLAAQPLVRLSYEMPVETFDININGTINILECIRKSKSVKAGIIITSDKCYENINQIWGYKETDRLGGYDPYSCSKACAELVTGSYINCFFNPNECKDHGKFIATVRAGNVIGGGDWSKDRIIPDIIRSLQNKVPIVIRNPNAIRPWQHVLEPLRGYLMLGTHLISHESEFIGAWNFGPNSNDILTVKDIVSRTIKLWGEGDFIISQNNGPHEAELLSIDCTKAKKYIKWNPILSIDEALKMTVEWYKGYKNSDVYELCMKQIETIEDKSFE